MGEEGGEGREGKVEGRRDGVRERRRARGGEDEDEEGKGEGEGEGEWEGEEDEEAAVATVTERAWGAGRATKGGGGGGRGQGKGRRVTAVGLRLAPKDTFIAISIVSCGFVRNVNKRMCGCGDVTMR